MKRLAQTLLLGTVFVMLCARSANAAGIIAHRGASHDAPENTLAAVRLGWERQADGVEIDVYLSKDGEIVVYHDKTTKRIGGRDKPVKDQTLAELRQLDVGSWKGKQFAGERIPTLGEVLATVPAGKRLFIEVKAGADIVPVLVRQLQNWPHTRERVVVIAFDFEICRLIKREIPAIPVCHLVSFKQDKLTRAWQPRMDDVIRQAKTANLDGIDTNDRPPVTAKAVLAAHDAGLKYFVWTVNEPDAARRLQAIGVDGITTDRPLWIRERLGKR